MRILYFDRTNGITILGEVVGDDHPLPQPGTLVDIYGATPEESISGQIFEVIQPKTTPGITVVIVESHTDLKRHHLAKCFTATL